METLRKHLSMFILPLWVCYCHCHHHPRVSIDIDRWMLFGGSWGATLSLIYAQTHPNRVLAMIIRGVFAVRRLEVATPTPDHCWVWWTGQK